MCNTTRPTVKSVVYKKIVAGDLRKFYATSNNATTGGGARDLRFSPAERFYPVFSQMFERQTDGSLTGYFHWAHHSPTEVIIHRPTQSRTNEIRIGRIHECFPREIIPQESIDCILLLIHNSLNMVYPFFTSISSLENDNWSRVVKQTLLAGLNAHRTLSTTAMGYFFLNHGTVTEEYTNGQI